MTDTDSQHPDNGEQPAPRRRKRREEDDFGGILSKILQRARRVTAERLRLIAANDTLVTQMAERGGLLVAIARQLGATAVAAQLQRLGQRLGSLLTAAARTPAQEQHVALHLGAAAIGEQPVRALPQVTGPPSLQLRQ